MSEKNTADGDGGASDEVPYGAERQSLATPEIDLLFEVLADRQRRLVLGYLETTSDGVAEYAELVEHVVAETQTEATDDARERVAANLHHRHLPKLADADLIDYDQRSETVRYWNDDTVPPLLELASDYETHALEA